MLDQIPEYSSDIEWLLQDKQVKENTILKALIPEHFDRTLRLAFSISMDPEEAILGTCETFANAILSRDRYSSDLEVQEWLDRILINICQNNLSKGKLVLTGGNTHGDFLSEYKPASDSELEGKIWRNFLALPIMERLPYLLHSVFFVPVPKVARLLGVKEGVANARLETCQRKLLAGLNGRKAADLSLDEETICSCLASAFQKQWESERLLPEGPEGMVVAIQTLVEDKRRQRRMRVILQEILLVMIVVVVVFTLVQVAVSLSADPSKGQISPGFWSYIFSAWF